MNGVRTPRSGNVVSFLMFVVALRKLGSRYAVLKRRLDVEGQYRNRDCFPFGGRDNRSKV
jgi:hypothetical protein